MFACRTPFGFPRLISLGLCVWNRECKRVSCFTASFLGCLALQTNPHGQGPGSPTENSLIRICCTNRRMLTGWESNKAFPPRDTCSSPRPDPAALGLVESYLAHMPPSQGLGYPLNTPYSSSLRPVCKTELKVFINGQLVQAQTTDSAVLQLSHPVLLLSGCQFRNSQRTQYKLHSSSLHLLSNICI